MDYSQWTKKRSKELYPGTNGRLQTEWQLTDSKLVDAVRLSVPPMRAIPIIFVPGIMGSNLCDKSNKPVWLLNSIAGAPLGLAIGWARKTAGERQAILHPERTKVYAGGAVPKQQGSGGYTEQHYRSRGWGEVSESSYHKFLLWLEAKMNMERNPANFPDFSHSSLPAASKIGESMSRTLPAGLRMEMRELPEIAEVGYPVDPVKSDELLKRSKFTFPIYGFGYNWLASNKDAAALLKARIEKVILENNIGQIKCTQVIVVTHSMGGLVARACSQLPQMADKIVGIVHGVMPATGAAVAYRRCKVGMRDEDFGAGLVIGSNGKEVTAVFAQSSGALQLLPSESYGPAWLEVSDPSNKILVSLPVADPYKEIYLEREKWWGLVREEWLSPEGGIPLAWDMFKTNILLAREFHRALAGKYHEKTYVFYGGGPAKQSFSKIHWSIKKGSLPASGGDTAAIPGLRHHEFRTDGSNNLYLGGQRTVKTTMRADSPVAIEVENSCWEVRCEMHDGPGDGTVPVLSGKSPRKNGKGKILQQFELNGVAHEPAYRDSSLAQTVAYYAITKLAALAETK